MILTPDRIYKANGLTINQYLLTDHNPNGIAMPQSKRQKTVAITIHNTDAITVSSNTTMAEQYTRATVNGAMNDVRVHYYVDDKCAWQCLPDDWINWSCTDGTYSPNTGNCSSVAIEVIGNSAKAEANAVLLAAYLLNKYNLNVEEGLRTHTYWLNVRDGKTGTIDFLNTDKNNYKWCPLYILPHWSTFKSNVSMALSLLKGSSNSSKSTPNSNKSTSAAISNSTSTLYRIRKDWDRPTTQIGAFKSLDNAIKNWKQGYYIFNEKGEIVYPTSTEKANVEVKNGVTNALGASDINVIYKVFATNWFDEVTNCNDNDDNGYAGIKGYPVKAIAIKLSKGTLRYRVHIIGGGWLSWITDYNINNWYSGYAGLLTMSIDGLQMEITDNSEYELQYRVSSPGTDYYDWVVGMEDYAGVFGKTIDKIQIKVTKKS